MDSYAQPNSDELLSFERLDRASPELWPEKFLSLAVPGVNEYVTLKSPENGNTTPPKWMADLENDDINLLHEFASLSTQQLFEKIRGLQNLAYQLGVDEMKEMSRGKMLKVLESAKPNYGW